MARPGRWRRFVLRPLVWAVVLLAVAVAGLALFLRTGVARERARVLLVARASEALGREIAVGRVEYELFPTTFVLHDVVVPGDRPGAADFARARRIEVEADFEGLRERVLELRRIAVEGLDVTVELRADGDNLPRPPRGSGRGRTLAVAIGGVSVDDARVHVDERTAPVSVRASAVLVRLAGLGGTDLEGALTAQEIDVALPAARPARFAFSGQTRIYEDRLELSDARLLSPDLTIRTSGRVGWSGGTTVDLTAAIEGSGAFLDRVGYLDGEIRGPFRAEGVFGYRERSWSWRADVASPALELFGFPLTELAGVASGDREAARFEIERGGFAGGALSGTFEIGLDRTLPARLDLGVAGADLESVLRRFDIPVRGLAGEVRGELEYAFEARRAQAGTGAGSFVVTAATPAGGRLPASGAVRLRLHDRRLELPEIALATPGQRVEGRATIDLESGSGEITLVDQSSELGELSRLVDFLPPGELWTPTGGRGAIAAKIELTPGGARVEALLDLQDAVAPGVRAERLTGELVVGPRAIERLDLALVSGAARLDLEGRVPLDERDRSLALDLVAEGWPVEEAKPWLPFELPLAGRMHGRLRLAGSTAEPEGELVATVEPASVAGVEAQRLEAAVRFGPERVEIERALLVAEAGEISAGGSLRPEDGALDLTVASAGLDLARPPFALDGARASGRLIFDARVGGTLAAPEATLDGRFEQLVVAGRPVEESEAPVTLRWSRGRVEAEARLGEIVRLTGGGEYDPERPARLAFRLESERLERLVALSSGIEVEGLAGSVAGELVLELAPDRPPALALELPALEFRYAGREVRALEPVSARLDAEGLRVSSFYLGLPGGEDELFVAGLVALGETPELDLNLQASLAASWFHPWLAGVEPGGRIEALGRVRGTPTQPAVNGQAEWSGGRYLPPGVPHTLENLRALVLFYPDAVVVDRLAAEFAGGRITASGRFDLPRRERELAYRLRARRASHRAALARGLAAARRRRPDAHRRDRVAPDPGRGALRSGLLPPGHRPLARAARAAAARARTGRGRRNRRSAGLDLSRRGAGGAGRGAGAEQSGAARRRRRARGARHAGQPRALRRGRRRARRHGRIRGQHLRRSSGRASTSSTRRASIRCSTSSRAPRSTSTTWR